MTSWCSTRYGQPAGPRSRSTTPTLLAEQRRLAADEGTFICPEGAACLAAARHLRASGFIGRDDRVVVLNTGTGI